jgi:hypothetical protein
MITSFLTIFPTFATTTWDRGFGRKHFITITNAQQRISKSQLAADALYFLWAEAALRICVKTPKSGLRLASLALWLLSPIGAQAATISAATPSLQDVSVAVAHANHGDTVRVPAGTATWTSGITITKNIYLIGAGSSQTIITAKADTIILWKPTIDHNFRLSGFRFNGLGYRNIVGIIGKCTQARIDHCTFNQGDTGIATNFVGWGATGRVAGVVDHCTFQDMGRNLVTDIRAADTAPGGPGIWGATSWNDGVQPGSLQMLYWEDNTFTYTSAINNNPNHDASFYGDYGGVAVIRHNTFSGYAYAYVDAHGDNPDDSTLLFEIYNNTFTQGTNGTNAGWFMNQRGGQRIMHDNIFHGANGVCELIKYNASDVHVVSHSYFWGDTWNTDTNEAHIVQVVDTHGGPWSSTSIHLGKNYFLAPPQSGQTFYPYKSLAYPHPLVTADGNATRPSPPASLRVLDN